jgi:hypothetical protein
MLEVGKTGLRSLKLMHRKRFKPLKIKSASLQRVHAAIDQNFDRHLDKCRAFLKLKSVSVTGEGIRETAERIKDILKDLNAEVSLCVPS